MAGELDRTLGVGIHSVGGITGDALLQSATDLGSATIDWNTLTTPGWYTIITSHSTNSPSDGVDYRYSLQVIQPDGAQVWQFAYAHNNAGYYQYMRTGYNLTTTPVWGSWRQPAQSGSNSNGNYVRFYDGTQICYGDKAFSPAGSTITTWTWTLPAAFTNTNYKVVSSSGDSDSAGWGDTRFMVVMPRRDSRATSSVEMKLYINSYDNHGNYIDIVAVGRWF